MKSLGDRMKGYEEQAESRLLRRLPVVIRIDGKAFHTLTSKLERPYCKGLSDAMARTLKRLCEEVSGCIYGYTQSDEMTLVLQNDANLDTEPLFDNRVQKLTSVVASMTTLFFAQALEEEANELQAAFEYATKYQLVGPALFDTRVFVVPSWTEAANCLIWRQQDATKNAISMAAQAELKNKHGSKTAQKMLHGKNGKEQQELLFQECGINFNNYSVAFRRGISCTKTQKVITPLMPAPGGTYTGMETHYQWQLNYEMPILRIRPEDPPMTSETFRTWGTNMHANVDLMCVCGHPTQSHQGHVSVSRACLQCELGECPQFTTAVVQEG